MSCVRYGSGALPPAQRSAAQRKIVRDHNLFEPDPVMLLGHLFSILMLSNSDLPGSISSGPGRG